MHFFGKGMFSLPQPLDRNKMQNTPTGLGLSMVIESIQKFLTQKTFIWKNTVQCSEMFTVYEKITISSKSDLIKKICKIIAAQNKTFFLYGNLL